MIIIYPLGNSDIQIKERNSREAKFRKIDPQEFRKTTKELFERINDCKENIELYRNENEKILGLRYRNLDQKEEIYVFPIFGSVYYELISGRKGANNKIYFICTNQSDENDNKQDTVFLFETLKYILKELLETGWSVESFVFTENPTDIEYSLNKVEELKQKLKTSKEDDLVVVYGPGVPTINYALILKFFDFSSQFYYAGFSQKTGKTELKETPIYGIMEKLILKNVVERLVNNYNYIAAYNVLSKLGGLEENLVKVQKFLEVIYYYMLFRFDEAKKALNEVSRAYSLNNKEKELYEILKSEVDPLSKNDSDSYKYVIPLLNIMQVYFESEMYNEWISLLFRLEEEFGKLIVEKLLGTKIGKNNEGKFKDFVDAINNKHDLTKYLNEDGIRYKEPNRIVFRKIIAFFDKKGDPEFKEVLKRHKEFSDFLEVGNQENGVTLSDLRNRSPFGHGFEGISKAILEDKTQKHSAFISDRIEELSKELLLALCGSSELSDKVKSTKDSDFVFNKINGLLKEILFQVRQK